MVKEIHIHVPAGLPDDEVIHVYLDAQGPELAQPQQVPAPAPPVGNEQAIEARLAKLERLPSASPKLRQFVADLEALGFTIRMPQGAEPYLRVMDPAAPAHGAGYLRASSITFTRRTDWEALRALDGAHAHSHGVVFQLDGSTAVEAARRVKRH
jgi:hypothetical protein